MKKKFRISAILALVFTLVLVSGVLAGSIGNIDGVWQYVEDNPDPNSNAYCVTYGTRVGTSLTAIGRNDPSVQTPPNTDENLIHYGKPGDNSFDNIDCPSTSANLTEDWFNNQSGLGFDGNNNVGVIPAETTFLIGRLTHYNKPIKLGTNTPTWQFMNWIDLDLTVSNVMCTGEAEGTFVPPIEGSTFTFTYRINFDETPNSCSFFNQCKYQTWGYCPVDGCPDAVTVGSAPPAQSFTCGTGSDPDVMGEYTLILDGFVRDTDGVCPASPAASYATQFITAESSTNHACLYGKVTDFVPAAVMLKDFSADIVDEAVLISWETLTEVNTLGFNLYRSETLDGEKELVNAELIMSNLAPGSLGGALYEYLDEANAAEAYYWLEEIEIDGTATSYGWTLAR